MPTEENNPPLSAEEYLLNQFYRLPTDEPRFSVNGKSGNWLKIIDAMEQYANQQVAIALADKKTNLEKEFCRGYEKATMKMMANLTSKTKEVESFKASVEFHKQQNEFLRIDISGLNGQLAERDGNIEELKEIITDSNNCFEAAVIEGLHERLSELENNDIGSLHDLFTRLLVYAYKPDFDTNNKNIEG